MLKRLFTAHRWHHIMSLIFCLSSSCVPKVASTAAPRVMSAPKTDTQPDRMPQMKTVELLDYPQIPQKWLRLLLSPQRSHTRYLSVRSLSVLD